MNKSRSLNWAAKSGWSIADQALFAGANFLVNILLARWLPESEYGSFAFCFSLFLFLGAVHTGFISEPMLVFGPGKYKTSFLRYLKILRNYHFILAGIMTIACLGLAIILRIQGHIGISWVSLSLAVSLPFMLLVWLTRRSCYVIFEPKIAVFGGLAYLSLIILGLLALLKVELLSAFSALLLVGFSGLISSGVIIRLLSKGRKDLVKLEQESVLKDHWSYGKWSASTGILQMTPGQLALLVLPIWAGIEASGSLKALSNLLMPVMHAYVALTVLMVPAFVRAIEKNKLKSTVSKVCLIILGMTVVYAGFIVVFGQDLIALLYKGKYQDLAPLLPIAALIPIVSSVVAVLSAAIKASERPDLVFWANLSSALCMISFGLALIYFQDVRGALLAQLISVSGGLLVLLYIYNWKMPGRGLILASTNTDLRS